jgi:hypothetical protein
VAKVEAKEAEASYKAFLTLKPIQEGFGDGMQPRKVYQRHTEATEPQLFREVEEIHHIKYTVNLTFTDHG